MNRITAARWLQANGQLHAAETLLHWHVGTQGPQEWPDAVLTGLAYRDLALIAETQGRTEQAIEYYRQFLRRYDMPPPQHEQWVHDAKEALARLTSTDPPDA